MTVVVPGIQGLGGAGAGRLPGGGITPSGPVMGGTFSHQGLPSDCKMGQGDTD